MKEEEKQHLISDSRIKNLSTPKPRVISEAYPPKKRQENAFQAKVHQLIAARNLKITPQRIKYVIYNKSMNVDFAEVKALHQE